MIEMTFDPQGQYVTMDANAWFKDHGEISDTLTESAADFLYNLDHNGCQLRVEDWIKAHFADYEINGPYGKHESPEPFATCTTNYDNFLDDDHIITWFQADGDGDLAGKYFVTQFGYWSNAGPTVYADISDDDYDVFDISQGNAGCSHYESVTYSAAGNTFRQYCNWTMYDSSLYAEDSTEMTKVYDLKIKRGKALCPTHKRVMKFWSR